LYYLATSYEKLKLGMRPINLDAFIQASIPSLPKEKEESAVAKGRYEYLLRYQKYLEKYRHLLGESPKSIPRNAIRSFVAQSSSDNSEKYYNYFAVKDVEIRCPLDILYISKKQEQLIDLKNRIYNFLRDADATRVFGAMALSQNEDSFLKILLKRYGRKPFIILIYL